MQVGFRTWYPGADERHIQRCKLKDSATSQAALGFKICGMQVCAACGLLLSQLGACICLEHTI